MLFPPLPRHRACRGSSPAGDDAKADADCRTALEPMMKVEVVTPQDYMGDVIGDVNSRRGQVQGMDSRGKAQVITAMVPLARLFGYVNTLRSMT